MVGPMAAWCTDDDRMSWTDGMPEGSRTTKRNTRAGPGVRVPVRILGISGSLAAGSSNTRLLEQLRAVARPSSDVVLYQSLDDVAHFSPERAQGPRPAAVSEL